jgi:hypothetical protein
MEHESAQKKCCVITHSKRKRDTLDLGVDNCVPLGVGDGGIADEDHDKTNQKTEPD